MKKLLIAAYLCASSMARIIVFECSASEIPYIAGFQGYGEIHFDQEQELDQETEIFGSFTFATREAGNDSDFSSTYTALNIQGTIKKISAMTNDSFNYVSFIAENEEDKFHAQLLLDFPKNLSSKFTSKASLKQYKANCETLIEI